MSNTINYEIETKEFERAVISSLGIIKYYESENAHYFHLSRERYQLARDQDCSTGLASKEDIIRFFKEFPVLVPDPVCRSSSDTTIFTTSGIQQLESMESLGVIERTFLTLQPVLRTQFIENTQEGTSTNFINVSVGILDATVTDFILAADKLIKLAYLLGAEIEDLVVKLEHKSDRWVDKSFYKRVLTLMHEEIELGESIYMQGFPISGEQPTNIVDLGFGLERFVWGINPLNVYHREFADLYGPGSQRDLYSSLFDTIKSMVLITGDGIKPSHKGQGYRLRQFSKKFVMINQILQLDSLELISRAYTYFVDLGYIPQLSLDQIVGILQKENVRNTNRSILDMLKRDYQLDIYLDVNQPTTSFLKQLRFSIERDVMNIILLTFNNA